ncbi:MAG TPA: DUF3293 domain-containing protein [Myxococcales bacterium]|nr:DUF3293 domain-containing protein [Myxococcales bacterium]
MPHFTINTAGELPRTPLLVHIPHSAISVPNPWRSQIILDDPALEREVLAMTDRYTDELFGPAALAHGGTVFINNLSRLIFDPERFEDDNREVMSTKGMGAVYTSTSELTPLRGAEFSHSHRDDILLKLFRPYATAFEDEVSRQLESFGRCLIVDAHSFPDQPLPYENSDLDRPDLCIGYDPYHASESLIAAVEQVACAAGWTVGRNTPFAGSYVPLNYYNKNPQVVSVMIEINRKRYMDEKTGDRSSGFLETYDLARELVETAVLFEAFRNTRFRAETPDGSLCIRVDEECPELDSLLERSGHESWVYITAYNPNGKPASREENARSQDRLERELREKGLTFFQGAGTADIGDWPPEPSFLVLGISQKVAADLCKRYAQAAVVVGTLRGNARLLLPTEETQ